MTETKAPEPVIKTAPAPKTTKIVRPWQGTFLAVLNIIGLIFVGLFIPFALLIAVGGSMLSFAEEIGPGMALLFGGGGLVLLLMLLFFFILGIFIVRGLFKGQKWVIIISLIFSALSAIQLVFNFDVFSALLVALFIYLEISCLLHPFYGGKK
jgi:hypothetical protein